MTPPLSALRQADEEHAIKIAATSSITMNLVNLKSSGSIVLSTSGLPVFIEKSGFSSLNGCGNSMWPCVSGRKKTRNVQPRGVFDVAKELFRIQCACCVFCHQSSFNKLQLCVRRAYVHTFHREPGFHGQRREVKRQQIKHKCEVFSTTCACSGQSKANGNRRQQSEWPSRTTSQPAARRYGSKHNPMLPPSRPPAGKLPLRRPSRAVPPVPVCVAAIGSSRQSHDKHARGHKKCGTHKTVTCDLSACQTVHRIKLIPNFDRQLPTAADVSLSTCEPRFARAI